jgi:hypothetical protein
VLVAKGSNVANENMQGVTFEQQVTFGARSTLQSVSWTSVAPAGAVFSEPRMLTWDYGAQMLTMSPPLPVGQAAARGFLMADSNLSSIQKVDFASCFCCSVGDPPADTRFWPESTVCL